MSLRHQGIDRRILTATRLHLNRLQERDVLAMQSKPTKKISTRALVFDFEDTALIQALTKVHAMLTRNLVAIDT